MKIFIPTPMYKYDIFISYNRSFRVNNWMRNFFLTYFEDFLKDKILQHTGQKPRVYYDQSENKPGDMWPVKLRDALKHSKVLVSICSPQYFNSAWCMSEWETFAAREQYLNRTGLRVPVRHNDCEQQLADIEYCDFYGLTTLASEFYQTIKAVEFEKKVEELAEAVALAVRDAPPFDSEWPEAILPDINPDIPMFRL